MQLSRRTFVRGGVTAFTFGFAAPRVLCDLAFAQGVPSRNLVVVYLGGGNDALSTVVPYRDLSYYSRRPTIAVPAGSVLQIGRDRSGVELGLHPRLTGLKGIFDSGRVAIVQRTGYENQSRSHFTGFDILGTASPSNSQGTGWLGRYLDSLTAPVASGAFGATGPTVDQMSSVLSLWRLTSSCRRTVGSGPNANAALV